MSLLKSGRLSIVSFLSELPLTQHDPLSFAVDLTIFEVRKAQQPIPCMQNLMKSFFFIEQPSMILLTVTGIFREKDTKGNMRSFHRSLLIVPVGSGFCIKNDMLHVNTLTMAQTKTAFKPITPAPVTTGPVQAPIMPTPTSALATTSSPPDDATKLQMIQAMSQMSQMNMEWSKK